MTTNWTTSTFPSLTAARCSSNRLSASTDLRGTLKLRAASGVRCGILELTGIPKKKPKTKGDPALRRTSRRRRKSRPVAKTEPEIRATFLRGERRTSLRWRRPTSSTPTGLKKRRCRSTPERRDESSTTTGTMMMTETAATRSDV